MTRACTYIISGFGFEIELCSTQGQDAAIRRAMWSLISAGHIEPEGTPEEMMAKFTVEACVVALSPHDRVGVAP